MIDTDKYVGRTEGEWFAENGNPVQGYTVEIVSLHSDEFREKWLADASLRHERQQDEESIGDRTELLATILGEVYYTEDKAWDRSYYEHNRLMLDDSYVEMQANINLMADAPLILDAYKEKCEEVKRLREAFVIAVRHVGYHHSQDDLWYALRERGMDDLYDDDEDFGEWEE